MELTSAIVREPSCKVLGNENYSYRKISCVVVRKGGRYLVCDQRDSKVGSTQNDVIFILRVPEVQNGRMTRTSQCSSFIRDDLVCEQPCRFDVTSRTLGRGDRPDFPSRNSGLRVLFERSNSTLLGPPPHRTDYLIMLMHEADF